MGGPVVIPHHYDGHNRTFFYFTYERQDFPGEDSGTGIVPDAKIRSGDFSELLPDTVITDPTTGSPFMFQNRPNVIDPARLSLVALKLQDFGFLQPNFGPANLYAPDSPGYNWVGIFPSADHDTRYVTRFDHQLRTNDALSVRASIRDIPEPLQFDSDLPIFVHNQNRQTRNAYVSETHAFGPNLVNEARLGFSRDFSKLAGVHKGAEVVQQVGLQGLDVSTKGDLRGVPAVYFNNFSAMQEFPSYFWMTQTTEFLDNLTIVKGKHDIKTGFFLRHNTTNISEGDDPSESDFGTLTFDGSATGFDYSDFLLGLPIDTERFTRGQPRYNRYNEMGLFVQDNFQVSGKLTLNLGLRYEYFPTPADKYDKRANFDPATGDLVLASELSRRLITPAYLASSIPMVLAKDAGFPERTLLNNHHKNFGPRVGFAYRPFGNGRTVVRGGYGVYFVRLTFSLMDALGRAPYHSREFFHDNNINTPVPDFQFPNPFPGIGDVSEQTVEAVSKDLRVPYTQQWNLTVERELPRSIVARISYRGFKSSQIPYSINLNQPLPSSDPANRDLYRFPNFSRVWFRQDGGVHKLNALDVQFERKFSGGLSFQSGWTWAKNLTDVGDDDESVFLEENAYNRRQEYGNVFWMPRHRWVSFAQYELPYGRRKRFGSNIPGAVDHVLGNWQISAVANFQTGQFLTPSFSGSDPSNSRLDGGRPDQIGNPNLPNRSIARWFDPSAFRIPGCPNSDPICATPAPVGRFGNSARGNIVGPGLANLDFGLFKYFTIKEKYKIQIRMTSTNFFNHPNFGNPNTDISSRRVGTIRGLQGGRRDTLSSRSRAIQVGFRLDF